MHVARALLPLALVACVACSGGGDGVQVPFGEVLTRHDVLGYSAELTVHDASCTLTGATASGPGIAGSAPLVRVEPSTRCEWRVEIAYGATHPVPLPTYTVAAEGTTLTVPVVCFQETFAIPNTPPSPTTSPVLLTWTGVPDGGTHEYLVTVGNVGGEPAPENPSLSMFTGVTNGTSVPWFAPAFGSNTYGGFRVFAGPPGWMRHDHGSCYSMSAPSAAFTVAVEP